MKQRDAIIKRQGTQIRFHNKNMNFMFNWILGCRALIGLSHGELFNIVDGMTDGGDVDCQVNSLRLARTAVFGWLHRVAAS